MQKVFKYSLIVFFSFLLIMTAAFIIFISFGYKFFVLNEVIWFLLNIITIAFAFGCLAKRKEPTKAEGVAAQALPLLALIFICAIAFLVDGVNDWFLVLHAFLCFACCFTVSVLYKVGRGKVVCIIFNSILFFFLLMGLFLVMTFGQIGQDTVVREVPSPTQTYMAILIASDQGALGGDTLVHVAYRIGTINAGLGRFVKIKRLYVGSWGEFETMTLEWEGEHILSIDGKLYKID